MKHILYIKNLCRLSLKSWLQYPADFFVGGIGSIIYTAMQLGLLYFMFENSVKGSIGGYSFQDFYLAFFVSQWSVTLFFLMGWDNVQALRKNIHSHDLDYYLTRPLHSYVSLLYTKVSISSILPMLFIQCILTLGLFFVGIPSIPLYLTISLPLWIILGFFLLQTLMLWGVSIQFYLPGFHGLYKFIQNLSETTQYPKDIFPTSVQFILMYIFPYFLITDPLYKAFQGTLTVEYFMFHFLFILFYIALSYTIFFLSLRRYGV